MEGRNIHLEVSQRVEAINCGGLSVLSELVARVGLAGAIDERLHLLKRHLPYHESDHVLAMVFNLMTGGTTLEDLKDRRRDPAFLDALGAYRIPDATTVGDFLRRFEAHDVAVLEEAIGVARTRVWQQQPAEDRRLALLDVDGSIVETSGRCKEGMDVSYDGRWGFCPLIVSLANTQEVLTVVNRPANRPSHDGCAPVLDRAIRHVRDDLGFEAVRLRGDTDFALTINFDRWTADEVEFVFGMDASPSFVRRAEGLDEEAWVPLHRPERPRATTRSRPPKVKDQRVEDREFRNLTLVEEHVAEIEYSPRKAKGTYRLVVLRKTIQVLEGQLRLEDETRYLFYATNVPAHAMTPAEVVRENNQRCDQENLIEQLKNGVQATRMPVREFDANWAYMVLGALAWNLKTWLALVLPDHLKPRQIMDMEFRRFLRSLIMLPAQILHTGRRLVFRFLGVNHWTRLLIEGMHALKRWRPCPA